MSDSWDDRRRAQEDGYFDKVNKQALDRIAKRATGTTTASGVGRPSPVTGKPMEQLTIMGVVVDRCPDSGGYWFDAGELEQILQVAKNSSDWTQTVSGFFSKLTGK